MLKFVVYGKPEPKQSTYFGNGRAYGKPKAKAYAKNVQLAFRQKYKSDVCYPVNMPLIVRIKVFVPIPESKSKKWKQQAEEGKIRPTIRPDVDNCLKNLNDSLNGLAYVDDKQIVSETIEKFYSSEPRVEVEIEGEY